MNRVSALDYPDPDEHLGDPDQATSYSGTQHVVEGAVGVAVNLKDLPGHVLIILGSSAFPVAVEDAVHLHTLLGSLVDVDPHGFL